MTVSILIAVIGGVSGIAGAIISALYARQLMHIQGILEEQHDISKARRDYEYEARKRLYSVYEPIKFQLVDLIGQALRRISMLSLAPPATGSVEEAASVYELLAPAALVRMMDRNLTLADMNLEHQISAHPGIAIPAGHLLVLTSPEAGKRNRVPAEPIWRVHHQPQSPQDRRIRIRTDPGRRTASDARTAPRVPAGGLQALLSPSAPSQ